MARKPPEPTIPLEARREIAEHAKDAARAVRELRAAISGGFAQATAETASRDLSRAAGRIAWLLRVGRTLPSDEHPWYKRADRP